jgi:class 3 adenylate cyclase
MKKQRKSKLAAIMFTDIVGYSRIMEENENDALNLLEKHNEIIFPLVDKFNGRIVNTIGDALLMDFDSALSATNCAFNIQRALAVHNSKTKAKENISLRIGIHMGDVWYVGDDILGDGVNIASRLEPLALPGGICISQDVYKQLVNKIEINTTYLGAKYLKNIKKTVKVYRLHTGSEKQVEDDGAEQKDLANVLAEQEQKLDNRVTTKKQQVPEEKELSTQVQDPQKIIKDKVFNLINTFMDKALTKWNKVPEQKKEAIYKKINKAKWFADLEHDEHKFEWDAMWHHGRQRRKKKGGEEIGFGLVASVGFGIAWAVTGAWYLVFPFVFVGLFPLIGGIVNLIRNRKKKVKAVEMTTQQKEKEILKIASQYKGKLNVLQVANQTDLSIEQARETLDQMTKKGYIHMEIDDRGVINYEFPEFLEADEEDDVEE